jgi:ATP-dependent DNA helicase RecQ
MTYNGRRAVELLRAGTGNANALLREGQEEAIQHVVRGDGRLLVVQKTGWGKSFVYFIAAKLLREAGLGPALLVSPLLALMRNQIDAAERMGVKAATINSDNQQDWLAVERLLSRNEVDLLLISPERLANERFQSEVLGTIAGKVSLLVVDEAHCISDWGHDFRPHYRLIGRTLRALPPNLRVLATTATANNRVMKDLESVLGPHLTVSRGSLNRPSLTLQTIPMNGQAERLAWLADRLAEMAGSGIIYVLTIADAHLVSDFLRSRGLPVHAYTGQFDEAERIKREHALLNNRVKALVATTALGMGFDKPDLAFVIHYQMPASVVHYYQQVGRAGRAIEDAYGILLHGKEDDEINDFFIESAFPSRRDVETVLWHLRQASGGLSVPELMSQVNLKRAAIDKVLLLLSLESPAPIVKAGSKWLLTPGELSAEFWLRAQRLVDLRRQEQQQMRDYAKLERGHMAFLVRALDGDASLVSEPRKPPLSTTVKEQTVREALDFLRRTDLLIEPRRQWVAGGFPSWGLRGIIPETLRAEPGRALCMWNDAGWGRLVRSGKEQDARFSEELVSVCKAMLDRWSPTPRPAWVTCIPSRKHPVHVPDFAARLAKALALPFLEVLDKVDDRPAQKGMENSAMQAKNVDGAFRLRQGVRLPAGGVLLVDDIAKSRWTLTVGAWLLRDAGVPKVWPLVLAQVGGSE